MGAEWGDDTSRRFLLRRGVLGNGLSTFRDGMLGQFTREQKSDSSLDLPTGDSRALVVMGQTRSLGSNALEDVVHKRIHDRHGLGGDTSVRVDLLQHLVDVNAVALLPPAFLLLVSLRDAFLGLTGLLGSLSASLGWHGRECSRPKNGLFSLIYTP